MVQKIGEPVSVFFICFLDRVIPKTVVWKNRPYPITKIGLHHTYRTGNTLYHVFSVVSHSLFFRLILNTTNLKWKLDQISDGLS